MTLVAMQALLALYLRVFRVSF